MKASGRLTRRDVLKRAAAAALGAPLFVPAAALGRNGNTPASERITLGAIGVGPRCTYDLQGILPLADVRCVAVCDVQASRRQAAKTLVDRHYGNQDCRAYRDFREPALVRDLHTNEVYVLLRKDVYERVRQMVREVSERANWDGPAFDVYDRDVP